MAKKHHQIAALISIRFVQDDEGGEGVGISTGRESAPEVDEMTAVAGAKPLATCSGS